MNIKTSLLFIIFTIIFVSISCEKHTESNDYLSLLKEIHKIECEHLNKAGVIVADTSSYNFRSEAFQHIMKNPDRRVLANYEELCSKLAAILYTLDTNQKMEYETNLKIEYSKKCD